MRAARLFGAVHLLRRAGRRRNPDRAGLLMSTTRNRRQRRSACSSACSRAAISRAKRQHGGVALISVISVLAITLGGVGADHHHVGDERLPRNAAVAHSRRERPCLRRRAQHAQQPRSTAGGARARRRPTCCRSRRSSTRRRWRPSDGMAAGVDRTRHSARRICEALPIVANSIRPGGALAGFRRRRIADHPRRRPLGAPPRRRRGHGDLNSFAAGRGHAVRTDAAAQVVLDRRHLQRRHGGVRLRRSSTCRSNRRRFCSAAAMAPTSWKCASRDPDRHAAGDDGFARPAGAGRNDLRLARQAVRASRMRWWSSAT